MEKARVSAVFQKYQWFWKACLMALLPPLCAAAMCLAQGFTLGQIYLPASDWNDELFYFKQVEAILHGGFPLGYFGYNESHALIGSFGVWSPVIYLPWVLWGLIFGWTYMSPIYFNITLLSLSLFCFTILSRPTGRQTAAMAALFCLFVPGIRYMLSGMAESLCLALLILFYGCAVGYLRHGEQGRKLAGMFAASVFLTLVRPYMLLILLLPVYLWIKKDRSLKRIVLASSIPVLTLGCYAVISRYMQASYSVQSFNTQWILDFLHGDLVEGAQGLLRLAWEQGKELARFVLRGFQSSATPGIYYIYFAAFLAAAGFSFLGACLRHDLPGQVLCGHLLFSCIVLLGALILVYDPRQGRHVLSFMGAGLLLVSVGEDRFPWKSGALAVALILIYTVLGRSAPDFAVPHEDAAREETQAYWTQAMGEQMPLEGDAPGYENTVIWVYSDYVSKKGGIAETDWRTLYAVPVGVGINYCLGEYVRENLDALQSRYIVTSDGCLIDEMCREAGYKELGRYGGTVCYIRY